MDCRRRSTVDDDRSRRWVVDDDRYPRRWAVDDDRSRIAFYQAQVKASLDRIDKRLRSIRRIRMPSATIPATSSSFLSSASRDRHQFRNKPAVVEDYPPLELPLRWRDPPPLQPHSASASSCNPTQHPLLEPVTNPALQHATSRDTSAIDEGERFSMSQSDLLSRPVSRVIACSYSDSVVDPTTLPDLELTGDYLRSQILDPAPPTAHARSGPSFHPCEVDDDRDQTCNPDSCSSSRDQLAALTAIHTTGPSPPTVLYAPVTEAFHDPDLLPLGSSDETPELAFAVPTFSDHLLDCDTKPSLASIRNALPISLLPPLPHPLSFRDPTLDSPLESTESPTAHGEVFMDMLRDDSSVSLKQEMSKISDEDEGKDFRWSPDPGGTTLLPPPDSSSSSLLPRSHDQSHDLKSLQRDFDPTSAFSRDQTLCNRSTTSEEKKQNEDELQQSDPGNEASFIGYEWGFCNVTAGFEYIPCFDNGKAIKKDKLKGVAAAIYRKPASNECYDNYNIGIEDIFITGVQIFDVESTDKAYPTQRSQIVRRNVTERDTITPNSLLKDDQTFLSANGFFELGFFSSGSSTMKYLGIWYMKIHVQTVVWRAIWAATATSNLSNPIAQLLDNDNFVLRNNDRFSESSESYIWESFYDPSDTLLPRMKLGWNLKAGLESKLTTWNNSNDPSNGDYTFNLDISGSPEIFIRHGSQPIYRNGPWTGFQFSGEPEIASNSYISFDFTSNQDEMYYTYKVIDSCITFRLVLNQSRLQRYIWYDSMSSWSLYWYVPRDQCNSYGECGPYGFCNSNYSPVCRCAQEFKPKKPQNWNLRDGSDGCVRVTKLDCEKEDGKPIAVKRLSSPSYEKFATNIENKIFDPGGSLSLSGQRTSMESRSFDARGE
ncbi:hypothetical protein M5K25_023159 [Dendrobium thyrsiflorum]|uniref:Bulb-type lectin domain-containing protein n=1 Tax=Dendrobium thyrsiflorum TaxID=117978 RepID=A0ABD0U7G2_DENTH